MIHIYTGDGKGKTSAALGLALRFSGYGGKVVIVQFGKGSNSGELVPLSEIPNIKVLRNSKDYGFWKFMSDSDKSTVIMENTDNIGTALNQVENGDCGLLILDELTSAYENNAVDRNIIDKLLKEKPQQLEIVITGRNAPISFLEAADYISEIKNVRHPYDKGEPAREGIEF